MPNYPMTIWPGCIERLSDDELKDCIKLNEETLYSTNFFDYLFTSRKEKEVSMLNLMRLISERDKRYFKKAKRKIQKKE